jgi:hypothetical protein
MTRIDVGGNRAGTQTGYSAYGFNGQVRVLIEGINTTEGTAAAGFYFDYASLEEAFLGTSGQSAEMPNPGVQSQFIAKSGGNRFSGEYHLDWYNNGLVGANIPDSYTAATAFNNSPIRPHSNEISRYYDTDVMAGGPIRKDKVWWFASYRTQFNAVQQPNFQFDKTFDTKLWNPVAKGTYQLNQKNKFVGYYQWGQKTQPNRLPFATYTYKSPEQTYKQNSGSWVYKGEWNGTLSNNMYAEARYGVFGYYFPLVANTDTTAPTIQNQQLNQYFNGEQKRQLDRHRGQATGAMTYFKDGWGGTHNFKFGGEWLDEISYFGYLQRYGGHVRQTINANGTPTQVVLDAPTATDLEHILSGPNGELLSLGKLTTWDAFFTDQFTVGRAAINFGVRYDRYRSWIPEQHQLAWTFQSGLSIPEQTFPEQTFLTWNSFAPRVGLSYDLFGTGKSVVKVNYGLYMFNPGATLAEDANPNQAVKTVTYAWNDNKPACTSCIPNNGLYEPGEEGNLTATALAGTVFVDPNLKQPRTQQVTGYLEQQFGEQVGARVGFAWVGVRNQYGTFQPLRPASAYSVPFSFVDRGPDGVVGSGDDQNLTFYGIPNSAISGCTPTTITPTPTCQYPTTQYVSNAGNDGTYKTLEFSVSKRQSHNWSANAGFGYTWSRDYPVGNPGGGTTGFPNTPNGPGCADGNGGFTASCDYSAYNLKATGMYNFKYGILASLSYRYQVGLNYARTVGPSAPASCNCTFSAARQGSTTNTTVYVSPYNAFRQDDISVIDVRIEKTIPIRATKVRLFGDIYNITNKYAAETINAGTGFSSGVSTFQTPTAILGPRTARVGFRFIW